MTTANEAAELIDRYVHEVARRLLPGQREDVSRELRSSLLDALEDRFGPEPTWVQAAVLLRETGPPREVAASYRPQDRFLIGPEWYPCFTRVLRIVLTVYLAVLVGSFAIALVTGADGNVGGRLFGFLGGTFQGGLMIFAVVVGIFHLLQRTEKPPEPKRDWDPEELPPVRRMDIVDRGETMLEIVLPAAFLALLWTFRDLVGVHLGSDGPLLLNDLFLAFLPWLSALIVGEMALGTFLVWRGRWSWSARGIKLVLDLFAIGLFTRLALAVSGHRAELLEGRVPEFMVDLIVRIAWAVPAIIAAIMLWGIGKLIYQSLRRPPGLLPAD